MSVVVPTPSPMHSTSHSLTVNLLMEDGSCMITVLDCFHLQYLPTHSSDLYKVTPLVTHASLCSA